jgi:nucleoside-diphosphate-sugar epimerase
MRVVVTGASGNVGTALLRALDGWDVLAVARHRPALAPPYSAARWITCDLGTADGAAVLPSAFAGADAVVHLAWAIHPRRGEPPMARTNQTGTANVLRAVVDAGVPHLVCASSVAAYSPAERWTSVSEDWRRGGVPGSAYSAGKAALEAQLDAFEERHPAVRLARIRPCGIVQRDAAAQFTDWLLSPWLPRGLLTRRWLPVPLWPRLRLQVVHTDDVARALRLVLASRATGAFNLAGEPVLTSRALAGIAGGARLPVPLPVLTAAAEVTWRLGLQPLHPAWLRLADQAPLIDTTRARTELGWTPTPDVGGVVADLLAAIRAGHRGTSGPLAPGRATVRLGRPSHQSQRGI